MIAPMVYALVLGALLGIGALVAEQAVRRASLATRGLWMVAMTVTVGVPTWLWFDDDAVTGADALGEAMPIRDSGVDVALGSAGSTGGALDRSWRVERIRLIPRRVDVANAVAGLEQTEAALGATLLIVTGPMAMVLVLIVDAARMRRVRSAWTTGEMDGVSVAFSTDFGPATVGIVRPTIVIPGWVAALGAAERALVMAHEREHERAHDGRVVALALGLVVLAPWNMVLWWQLRRLRVAIELDCDQRVLGRESTPEQVLRYGRLLLETGRRARGAGIYATALSDAGIVLKRRIEAMTERTVPLGHRRSITRLGAALVLGAAACVLEPPSRRDLALGAQLRNSLDTALRSNTIPLTRPLLTAYVADSVTALRSTRPEATAFDLPVAFVADTAIDSKPKKDRDCDYTLRDPRDGTVLRLMMSHGQSVTLNGGAALSVVRLSVGYYAVLTPGRYGVGAAQTLRVSCPTRSSLTAMAPGAPRVAAAIKSGVGLVPESIRASGSDLVVTLATGFAAGRNGEALDSLAERVARVAWAALAHPTSIKRVTIVYPGGTTTTRVSSFFYPGRDLPPDAPR